jgi:hypothetical protein
VFPVLKIAVTRSGLITISIRELDRADMIGEADPKAMEAEVMPKTNGTKTGLPSR